MFFVGRGRFRRNTPGMTRRRGTGWHSPHSPERGRSGSFQAVSGTDPGGIQLGWIPIGGIIWYFQSMR